MATDQNRTDSLRSCPKCRAACLPEHRHCPACSADLADAEPTLAGTVLARKYVLRELLGEGGMAAVYLADQLNLGRTVAIKILHSSLSQDPALISRFTDEARAASSLQHPHIVSIMDFGQSETGLLYIVMEHLRGRTLSRLIAESAPLPVARVTTLLEQVLDALAEAHGQGVVHRDLKPENIMVETLRTGGDFAKVLDFGIAKLRPEKRTTESMADAICGTPEYMAPEQVRAEKTLDGRADLYAVGVLTYEMLTGVSPFAGESAIETLERQLRDTPPPMNEVRPEAMIPPALEEFVRRALAKSRDDRFGSAAEMRAALDECQPRRAIPSPRDRIEQAATLIAKSKVVLAARPEHERIEALIAGKPGATLVLRGPDGSGKTTLLTHARAIAERERRPLLLIGPDPLGAMRAWYPIRQLCRRLLGLRGRPTLDMIDQAIRRIAQPAADLPGLAMLFGIAGDFGGLEHAARRRECFASALRVVRHAAGQHSAVVVFEDVDHFDAPSRTVVERLIDEPASSPLTLLCTTRAGWDPPSAATVVDVAPLERTEITQLAGADAPVEDILLATGGLPLHVSEVVRSAAVGVQPPFVSLDQTISGRMAQLGEVAQGVLSALAIAGGQADTALLEAIDVLVTHEALAELETAGFVTRVGTRLAISHPCYVDVARERTSAELRKATHTALWKHMTERQAKPTLVAVHAAATGGADAIATLEEAGQLAQREFDEPGAAIHYRRAVELARWQMLIGTPNADITFITVSIRFGEALLYSGDPTGSEGVLREALEYAQAHPALAARVRLALSRLAASLGRLETAERELRSAWRVGFKGEATLLAELYLEFAGLCMRRGDLEAAIQDLDEGISLCTGGEGAQSKSGPELLWRLVGRQAEALMKSGQRERAVRVGRFALSHAQRVKSLVGEARMLALLGELHEAVGSVAEAEASRQAALVIFRKLGDRKSTAEILLVDAQVALGRRKVRKDTLDRLEEAARLAAQVDWREGVQESAKVVDLVVRQSGSTPPA
jgi:serine/threonine-protein kinase